MNKRMTALLALTLWAGIQTSSWAASIATQTLNYQGQLTDATDSAYNGNANLAFQFWDALSGGNAKGGAIVTSNVPVSKGLFNVDLPTSGLSAADLNGPLYLEVTVNGELLTPRRQVLASMFALNADRLQGYQPGNGANQIPVLDASGRLAPAVVSAPFPLQVTGSASLSGAQSAALIINLDPAAGQGGLYVKGASAGVSAAASANDGAGVVGSSAASDTAAASGVKGMAVNGVGVRAQANAANTTALQSINGAGLGLFAQGNTGAQVGGVQTGLVVGGAGLGGQSPSDPQTGIAVQSSVSGISVNNAGSGAGVVVNQAQSGSPAMHGIANSALGTAVRGEHRGGGQGIGVHGSSAAAGGVGVLAQSSAVSGAGAGLRAQVSSPGAIGIDAQAPSLGLNVNSTAPSGAPYAALVTAASTDAQGLHADANGAGASYGLVGAAPASASGAGVWGSSSNIGVLGSAAGSAPGVQGQGAVLGLRGLSSGTASGAGAVGVQGTAQAPDGVGVQGQSQGAGSGVGVQGLAGATGVGVSGSGGLAGVSGALQGANGAGVAGDGGGANAGNNRAGVSGSVTAASGEQVFGVKGVAHGSSQSAFGVWGESDDPNGRGVRAFNSAALGGAAGYALGVTGKLRITTDNAGLYTGSGAASSWVVSCQFCNAGNLVLVSPAKDITAGGTQPNALWVDPAEVVTGAFTVRAAAPVANAVFYYVVVDR
jgi:hypothetical protein